MDQIKYLKTLALLGCDQKPVRIAAKELEKDLKSSDKTISRNLKYLEEKNMIERGAGPTGQSIKITPAGMKLLSKEFADYKKIFSVKEEIELEGVIASGLGEGQYYISIDGYMKQFKEKLGFTPFPGTLNVKIKEYCADARKKMAEMPYIKIDGFSDGQRTYGASDCYPAKINGLCCFIIVPERTHYQTDLLEIIAPVKIREALKLTDGEKVTVVVGNAEV
ncbi:MAG: winged helix-turn-helix domain-containing protein/riboflavin kinase [Methanimicrococcus sp.]|nr:winged helix-turn-helix domain-containing protein/riboflavin kinase [Methanimicrococcus sp.]